MRFIKCDRCGKEAKSGHKEIQEHSFLIRTLGVNGGEIDKTILTKRLDLCKDCSQEVIDILTLALAKGE